ncbi:MAG: ornithine carbamoyltransferase [Clostridiales bacterium]|nr:ornithine carbamoyltransferase [Clostridiales bacterium]
MIEFTQKHLLTLADWSPADILVTLNLADRLKTMRKNHVPHPLLAGKTLAMIFTKSSTRTRVSFEVGIHELGGYGLFLSGGDIQLGRGETIADTARVLSRYVDGIMIRTFRQSDVEALAQYGAVPVINGLTDDYHPCQILADLMTIRERKGELAGRRLAFIGDGNNVANSLLLGCAKTGMHIAVASPEGYEPSAQVISRAREIARKTGGSVLITREPREAVRGADAVYTDVWASMGQESQQAERRAALISYHVDEALMGLAASDALFLHCLPAHRGEEVAPGVIDGPHSAVFDEAENRLHAQKAIMALLMGQPETLCKI